MEKTTTGMLTSLIAHQSAYVVLRKKFFAALTSLETRRINDMYQDTISELVEENSDYIPNDIVNNLKLKTINEESINDNDEIHQFLLIPLITNLSFMNEIALKTLIHVNGDEKSIVIKKHKLSELFYMLNDEQKERIKSQFDDCDFDSLLEENENHFVDWRYSYEGCNYESAKPNMAFLERLYSAINAEIQKII